MTLDIKIPNADAANKLNKAATEVNDVIWVHSKNGMIMVDARSLIGLYALVGEDSVLVAEDNANPDSLIYVAKRASLY